MIFASGKWKAESGRKPSRSRCATNFRVPRSARRFGLTLIELLITITILATLAGVFLGVSGAAMESARSARTKSTISKIHSLLMERWESYSTRRVELNPNLRSAIYDPTQVPTGSRGLVLTDARLLATRELMKLEMPDRWTDVTNDPDLLASLPAITRLYRRQFKKAEGLAIAASDPNALYANQSAECLYMIVMFHSGDGEARTLFSRQDIGDTDDDGAQEFLDGWGRPIEFIRWPAGFFDRSDQMTGNAETDHDPFDPYRRDYYDGQTQPTPELNNINYPANFPNFINQIGLMRQRYEMTYPNLPSPYLSAFRLVPLVYSVGNDGEAGLHQEDNENNITGLDPYELIDGDLLGLPISKESLDNIHNQLQDGS